MLSLAHNIPTSYLCPLWKVVVSNILYERVSAANRGSTCSWVNAPYNFTSHHDLTWQASSLSCLILALKHVETNIELEGRGLLRTQPMGKRTVFMHLTVSFNAVPCEPSLAARLSDTQELLQAVSHKTNAVVLVREELLSLSSFTWRSPLTSVTEIKVVGLLGCCWPVFCLLVPTFGFDLLML